MPKKTILAYIEQDKKERVSKILKRERVSHNFMVNALYDYIDENQVLPSFFSEYISILDKYKKVVSK